MDEVRGSIPLDSTNHHLTLAAFRTLPAGSGFGGGEALTVTASMAGSDRSISAFTVASSYVPSIHTTST